MALAPLAAETGQVPVCAQISEASKMSYDSHVRTRGRSNGKELEAIVTMVAQKGQARL